LPIAVTTVAILRMLVVSVRKKLRIYWRCPLVSRYSIVTYRKFTLTRMYTHTHTHTHIYIYIYIYIYLYNRI
jgi:hypothetical protein